MLFLKVLMDQEIIVVAEGKVYWILYKLCSILFHFIYSVILFYIVLNMQRTSEYENDVFSKDISFFMFCKLVCTDMPPLSDCYGKVTGSYKKRAVRYFL